MWKVKRMNTARIVVLTIAIGAGGIAATLASGPVSRFAVPAAPIAQLQTSQQQIWPAMAANNNFICHLRPSPYCVGTLPLIVPP